MGLREIAERDVFNILTDSSVGAAVSITVTPPGGADLDLTGYSNDIAQMIDPETGMAVSGRTVSVSIPIRSFVEAGVPLPRAILSETSNPWVVQFSDNYGRTHTWAVTATDPDYTLGFVNCILEDYQP